MNRRYLCIIFVILILMAGCFLHSKSSEMPSQPPTTIVKYKDSVIPTSIGEHNWIPKNGGSSYETGADYEVGEYTSEINAKSGDTITISVPYNPLSVEMYQLLNRNDQRIGYSLTKKYKEYIFTLPSKRGDYVFEVFAKWDSDRHNTATIFKVFIE
ncbi:hypothetical protein IAI10_22010 [Clostridium sp. 19966]|uniref:hypothetical protein n=1 Tax=Clostridium sp. 19966 TaxID=2768166 RepID=UPI0028DE8735|nr:hypothetical protein [Clostridium sp. 19966]MDT8719333.1 hypothetical protein [Clostridium sp. 19966]